MDARAFVTAATVLLTTAACGTNNAELPPELLDAIRNGGGSGSYPEGPYGTATGDTLPDLCLSGWQSPDAAGHDATRAEPICLRDFHRDASARILLVNSSALWCVACKSEYGGARDRPGLSDRLAERASSGFRLLGTLFETNDPEPATLEAAAAWTSVYAVDFPFAVDDTYALGASNIAPTNRVVDTRTMKVLLALNGDSPGVLFSFIDERLDD